ncbi:MAG TPA: hypothetical protein VFQ53_26730 [Kofleriaceae bacterium]|nr:hypothetical protein [Kofleriaceae bacterium]
MRRMLVLVLLLGLTGRAHADDDADSGLVFVGGHLALNAPLGEVGVEAGVGLSWFRASVSSGYGVRGVERALILRAMTGAARQQATQWGIGVGISRGPALHSLDVGWSDPDDPPELVHFGDGTFWRNVELVVEHTARGGQFLRAYVGISDAFAIRCVAELRDGGDSVPCTAENRAELAADIPLPYVGVAVGMRWPKPPSDPDAWRHSYPSPLSLPPPPML